MDPETILARTAINALFSRTLEYRRSSFEALVLEIVRCGIAYREKQGKPITTEEIDAVNGHIYEIGFKFPELWDKSFRDSLKRSMDEIAQQHVRQADARQEELSLRAKLSQELVQLKDQLFLLSKEMNREKAGIAHEGLLNRLFMLFELNPRPAFRIVGEQIDGSFTLDGEVYLVESKWEKYALPEADLLVFRGKIEGKSTFTRGVFIALNDVTEQAVDAITRGESPSFFVMNGYDLLMVLSEAISLRDFLRKRVRLLAEEGQVCIPFSELTSH